MAPSFPVSIPPNPPESFPSIGGVPDRVGWVRGSGGTGGVFCYPSKPPHALPSRPPASPQATKRPPNAGGKRVGAVDGFLTQPHTTSARIGGGGNPVTEVGAATAPPLPAGPLLRVMFAAAIGRLRRELHPARFAAAQSARSPLRQRRKGLGGASFCPTDQQG